MAAKSYAAAAAGSSLLCTERNAPQWDQHITSPRGQYEASAYIGMSRFCFMMEKYSMFFCFSFKADKY